MNLLVSVVLVRALLGLHYKPKNKKSTCPHKWTNTPRRTQKRGRIWLVYGCEKCTATYGAWEK